MESMKRAFVSVASSYVGSCVASVLRFHGYEIFGSVRSSDTESAEGLVSQTADVDDEATTAELALRSDVIVLCILEDLRGADAVLTALCKRRYEAVDGGGPSHLLLLSTTMTWAKSNEQTSVTTAKRRVMASPRATSATAGLLRSRGDPVLTQKIRSENISPDNRVSRAGGLRGKPGSPVPAMTERDYLRRRAPAGFLEHKRLEIAALNLRSKNLSVCVVVSGMPYGLGEGPLFQVFQKIWKARKGPAPLPTCTYGDNMLSLIYVVDLSVAVGALLRPGQNDSPPSSFPKPYILAVEGNDAQCTAKELAAAIGQGFGGSGETRPIEESALEEMLIDHPEAMSLLIDVRFSNEGGVLAGMVASGKWTPVAWSAGFVAFAEKLAQDFVSTRSLNPIKAVVLGPPGGDQDHVCERVSQRYGMIRVDAKVAADWVFEALGKPLPKPAPPGEKRSPPPKNKKAKRLKKEPQVESCTLTPTERLLRDIETAFEAAGVSMAEYSTLDATRLAHILTPPLVAKLARCFLENTRAQWDRCGFILCDIPSRRDAVPEVFGASSASPQTEPGSSGLTSSEDDSAVRPRTSAHDGREIHPTHVVHLDAGRDYIMEKCGKSTNDRKNIADKVKIEFDQYLAEEHDRSGPEGVSPKEEPAQQVVGQEPSNARNVWMPRTVRALRDNFGAEAVTLEAERDVSATVEASDLFLTGGEVPASVRMLSDDGDETTTLSGEEDGSGPDVSKPKASINEGEPHPTPTTTEDKQGAAVDSGDCATLAEVLAKLSAREAMEVETRTQRHRRFLISQVMPQVVGGLTAAADARTEDPIEFLAEYLIRAGKSLQRKAEAEAALKYQAGLALLREMDLEDIKLRKRRGVVDDGPPTTSNRSS